uniref:Protein adenylyltransferase FICD n=1 Tax=Phallusia mammillata TaxID=59560 RepID=A0A6F9DDH3_9ASCI|nr:adenosine monophosphate-protein transferase FICD-like [Phallusia mammillata]
MQLKTCVILILGFCALSLVTFLSLSTFGQTFIYLSRYMPSISIQFSQPKSTEIMTLANTKYLVSQNERKSHLTGSKGFGILVSSQPHSVKTYSGDLHTTKTQQEGESSGLEEVKACLRKARALAEAGNRKLALKLYKHALALSPNFSESLNEFGEFLENENVVQADLLYQRALFCDPEHSTALTNRKRTAPLVLEHDKNVFVEIDDKKKELYKYSSHHPTLRSAMKEFYYQHIYHTVAIEGNTMTLEQIRQIIDHKTVVAGKSIMEHNEVIGIAEALAYMNNTLLMNIGEITIEDIKSIHKRVMGFVDPIAAGEFRTNQVYVGGHIPPHPNDVELLMDQFEDWLNSPDVIDLHPVEYAAIAHYRLVYIHPFVDGNGRTARLLMNFILMQNGFPPVSVELQHRWEYYETLTAANTGDLRPFIRFIARCTSKTLEDYLVAAELPYLHEHNFTYQTLSGQTTFIPKFKETESDGVS